MSNVISPNAAVAGFGNSAAGCDNSKAVAVTNVAKSLIHESDFEDFPKIDVIELIKLINEVSKGKKDPKDAAKEFGAPYAAFAKVFVINKSKELFSVGFEKAGIKDPNRQSIDRPDVKKPKAKYTTKSENAAESIQSIQANAKAKTASKPQSGKTASRAENNVPKSGNRTSKSGNKVSKTEDNVTTAEDQTSKSDIQDMMEGVAKNFIDEVLAAVGLQELSNSDFDEKLIACVMSTAALVKAYMARKITDEAFIEQLGQGQIKELTMQVLSALGVDMQVAKQIGVKNLSEIGSMAPNAVAFAALTAAYKMVRQAEKEMQIARERRIEIEDACNESIALIRQYRQEMEYVVNNYLTERLEIFEKGFEAMDKAILEDDTDGYIKGNAAIQEILGYKAQFSSQKEFDDLMDSDDAFRL